MNKRQRKSGSKQKLRITRNQEKSTKASQAVAYLTKLQLDWTNNELMQVNKFLREKVKQLEEQLETFIKTEKE